MYVNRKSIRWFATGTLLLLLKLSPAQTIDTGIVGTVTDPASAVVTGATVTITSTQTGVARSVTTNPSGLFEVRYLVPGEYTV
ncbi:MAG TPA: carboxypeptidase-like regulatory domain-containing protein, partial [Bryobacteraceae bacterium]|nr:carboxypeptidase-like regulatory domain-containing protein [Bryobacteraceae bacterium]